MLRYKYSKMILAIFIFCVIVGNIYASKVVEHDINSPAIAKNMAGISGLRHIAVYLPDGYDNGNQRYPVLYIIHGWTCGIYDCNGKPADIVCKDALDEAINADKFPPVITVAIDVHEGVLFLNSPVFGNWEDFLVMELIPFVDKNYRTLPDRSSRGIIGHSAGGYAALMLSVLHPGVFSTLGANDPMTWAMWIYIRDVKDFTADWAGSLFFEVRNALKNPPQNPADALLPENFWKSIAMQIGTAVSPNLSKPGFFDSPVTQDGDWVPEIREKWQAYDLTDLKTIAKNSETLNNMSSINIIVPANDGNRDTNINFIGRLQSSGISVNRLDMRGGHCEFLPEQTVAFAENMLKAMQCNLTSISPKGKIATLLGEIKKGNFQ